MSFTESSLFNAWLVINWLSPTSFFLTAVENVDHPFEFVAVAKACFLKAISGSGYAPVVFT